MIPTRSKAQKHPLKGHGPIVDRARQALGIVAKQFGTVMEKTRTTVAVKTPDGIQLSLSYAPGNYIFSRVYGLTITAKLPVDSPLPEAKLTHRSSGGPRYISTNGDNASKLRHLNELAAPYLKGIDIHSSEIASAAGSVQFTITPLGGAYVWVLIPPVFKSTAFPQGEPERILNFMRAIRDFKAQPRPNKSIPTL